MNTDSGSIRFCVECPSDHEDVHGNAGRVEKGKDPNIQTNDDVCRLAGALARTSMPAPTQVAVNGKKLS